MYILSRSSSSASPLFSGAVFSFSLLILLSANAALLHAQDDFGSGADLGQAFVASGETGQGFNEESDAGIYLEPGATEGRADLSAYSLDRPVEKRGAVPGLVGLANHVRSQQAGTSGDFRYSLAEAMADALWRKQVVDALYRSGDEQESEAIDFYE